jgi:predicted ATPase
MRLLSVAIVNYRRFADQQTIYLGPRVIAVVGPNEAGKTSLLQALSHLPADPSFSRREFTGRQHPPAPTAIVSGRYEVEADDREIAQDLLDDGTSYLLTHVLYSDGTVRWDLSPNIERSTTPRARFCHEIADLQNTRALLIRRTSDDGPDAEDVALDAQAATLAVSLSEAAEDLADEQLVALDSFSDALAALVDQTMKPDVAGLLLEHGRELGKVERLENPRTRLYQALVPRLPQMLEFTEEHRALLSDYPWVANPEAPPALENLLYLAGVSYADYRALAIDRDRREELSTYERKLNRAMKARLMIWSQSNITITLKADSESLAVHVTDVDTDRDVLIDERSAGMRMFASLLAFCARFAGHIKPILLFDEAETHLHYGAQADLMEVFAHQDIAQAVIYTTHSIGCLPEDLGRSIRVVAPIQNEQSQIRNEFWTGGVGLTPLMLAMGASAMAFSPARYVLLGEGPTEAILLPTLFRSVLTSRDGGPLGFQVACGTAQIPADFAPTLESEAGNVAYLFDADAGGLKHAEKISQRARDEGRVLVLGDGLEPGLCTEDLINPDIYALATNEILRDTRNTDDTITSTVLPAVGRADYVVGWCRERGIAPLSKVRVAERVLRLIEGRTDLVDPARAALVLQLYEGVRGVLTR